MYKTTFVSILYEWTAETDRHIDFWVSCKIPFYLYVCKDSPNYKHLEKHKNIKVHPIPYDYRETWCYQSGVSLPEHRNIKKDTEEFLWNGHAKVEYVAKTVEINPFGTEYYAWVDLCLPGKKDAFLRDYMRETYSNDHTDLLYIPGCISAKSYEPVYDRVNWRFCGSFFMGSISAIQEFMELYFLYFSEFFEGKLTWEVNFWAWLETVTKDIEWKIRWYYSDHCETVLKLPETAFILKKDASYKSFVYDYFPYENYRPTSASYLFYQDRHWLNTRYVNYFLTPTGCYSYPDEDRTIRNKNVCSELCDFVPKNFLEMKTNPECLGVRFQKGFSEGIEDIRLYEFQDEIRFIGTTLSYSNEKDKLRIIRGTYDISGVLSNAQVIMPPTNTYCEKNWIPWIDGSSEYFIYKWCPLEIGRVETDRLVIIKSIPTNPLIFSKIRGSTLFIPMGSERIGVVHYSEETVPRQYYHRFVIMDNMEVKRYSDSFCFEKIGVEFCIGFTIVDTKFVFWISQMDRDPMMVEIEIDAFREKWNI